MLSSRILREFTFYCFCGSWKRGGGLIDEWEDQEGERGLQKRMEKKLMSHSKDTNLGIRRGEKKVRSRGDFEGARG